jgi:hypothetical protein
MFKKSILLVFMVLLVPQAYGQKGMITAGVQIKPILPFTLFNASDIQINEDIYRASIDAKTGISYGGIIRVGITDRLSIETGLHYVRRNYRMRMDIQDSPNFDEGSFAYINFELPVQAMVFVRLSERLYMNTALGFGINMWPSSIRSIGIRNRLVHDSLIANRVNFSFLGNMGFEFRTEEKGFYYLGVSLTNPLGFITRATILDYRDDVFGHRVRMISRLNGEFFTLDFRYLFQ